MNSLYSGGGKEGNDMKIGFIGAGNMASSLIGGMIQSGMVSPGDAAISDRDMEKLSVWKEKGVFVTADNAEIEERSDLIVFAVKPNVIAAVPNTPAMVGCGMTVVTPNANLSQEEQEMVLRLFNSIGAAMLLPEKELEIATAIHGSSPAYIYMMIDAMADAGVRYGLTKANALKLAAKAVEGSAKMVLETGIHPEQLKDNVCSPGGTTIAAVCELERTGFRASLQTAIDACIRRNAEMNQ